MTFLQPRYWNAFRCIGAECEDTCCAGWIVNVDKPAWDAYQRCNDPELAPRLREFVTINPERTSDDNHARLTLTASGCAFLSNGLCSIQSKLGEESLPYVCAVYPRVTTAVDDMLFRSLDLSCPEAARIVLLDPNPIEFVHEERELPGRLPSKLTRLSTSDEGSSKPYRHFDEIHDFVVWLLQYRAYPLWKRLAILGLFCDRLQQIVEAKQPEQAPPIIEEFRNVIGLGLLEQALNNLPVRRSAHLQLVLELIVARIGSDYTAPRFLECYREFMEGLEWTAESTMDEIGDRYSSAFAQFYEPFLLGHGYMLEHWLVSYVHRTLFPLRAQEAQQEGGNHLPESIRDQCLLMTVHYAVIQTVLVGMARFHQAAFGPDHVVKVVQAAGRAFGHSLSFPPQALQFLAEKKLQSCASLAILVGT